MGINIELKEIFAGDEECPSCKYVAPLTPEGLCWDCTERKREALTGTKQRVKSLAELLGGQFAVTQYTFERVRRVTGNDEAVENALSWDPKVSNTYYYGPCGSGKDHLAKAILQKWYLEGCSAYCNSVSQFLLDLRAEEAKGQKQIIDKCVEADILYWSEFGLGGDTDYSIRTICSILDRRTDRGKNGLLFTSNMTLKALRDYLNDDRMASRLYGKCDFILVDPKDKGGKSIDWRVYQKNPDRYKL